MTKTPIKFLATSILCLFASQSFAHEGIKYDCGDDKTNLMVEFFEAEGRAQITHNAESFGVIYNDKDGYLNVFKQAQFYPENGKTRVYISSKQFECVFPSDKPKTIDQAEAQVKISNPIYTGRSLGGKVRIGASMQAKQIASLYEGDPIIIMNDSGVEMNGYDWFEIKFKNGKTGYQWGGIMCSDNEKINGLYQQCQ
ncbi:MAG: SH3 domain-containing protein [Hyphomicrobiales bacterium]